MVFGLPDVGQPPQQLPPQRSFLHLGTFSVSNSSLVKPISPKCPPPPKKCTVIQKVLAGVILEIHCKHTHWTLIEPLNHTKAPHIIQKGIIAYDPKDWGCWSMEKCGCFLSFNTALDQLHVPTSRRFTDDWVNWVLRSAPPLLHGVSVWHVARAP